MAKSKIKINDNIEIRNEIEKLTENISQMNLLIWSIFCAESVLKYFETKLNNNNVIKEGFEIIELWKNGKVTVYQIRQMGFKIHKTARECNNEAMKSAIRTFGQAVSVAHMKEHAIVCSDYAIKTIQLIFKNDIDKITEERNLQFNELKKSV